MVPQTKKRAAQRAAMHDYPKLSPIPTRLVNYWSKTLPMAAFGKSGQRSCQQCSLVPGALH